MSDYIERDKAINAVFEAYADGRSAYIALETIPAADVRPVVRGKWKEDWETGCSECSACGESYLWEDYSAVAEWNYCPNCGARMDGDGDV